MSQVACPHCDQVLWDSRDEATQHTLTLEFHRLLSEAEWREVIEAARQVSHVKHLHANAPMLRPEANNDPAGASDTAVSPESK